MVSHSVGSLQALATALAAVQGAVGLWTAYWLDVPPGPVIAVLGGAVFGCVLAWRGLVRHRRGAP
jgi:ABC-type Mn2+/Zn2+ transport system permease subunit